MRKIHQVLIDREQQFNARVAKGTFKVMKDGKLLASATNEEAAQKTANGIPGAVVVGPKRKRRAA